MRLSTTIATALSMTGGLGLAQSTGPSNLNEALPYWVNGLVPLAYTLQDERLKEQVSTVVDTVLDRIQPDGWIGPETVAGGQRMIWARTLIFLGLTNLADANATYEKPIVDALHRFNGLMNSMLKNNGTGMVYQSGDKLSADDFVWFQARSEDMIVSLQWLLDYHPGNQTNLLKQNIEMIYKYASKWEGWYTEENYVSQDLYDVPASVTDDQWPFLHGVTVAEGLKYAAVMRRSTSNESLLTTAKNGVDWTFKYHGSASGTILADERLAGLNPYYGSELCTDVEVIYSLAYNFYAIGDSDYADRAELAAFNALPAAVSGDWWSHQYMTEPNQPFSKNLSATPFWNVNTLGQTFGVEPDYPCCTVNHPQGYPKFAMYSYVRNGDTGIVHSLLSPGRVQTEIQGKIVSVDCQTDYPFDNTLSYTVDSDVPFQLYLRVPNWATQTKIQGSPRDDSAPKDPKTGLIKLNLPAGTTKFSYQLGMDLITADRANDTVAVYRGPLLYALHIPHTTSAEAPRFYNTQKDYPAGTYPDQAHDYALLNTTEWNVAIDPSTLEYHAGSGSLPEPTFTDGQLPMYMTARACLIDWPMFRGAVPDSPIPKSNRTCLSDIFEATLRPYGSAKLHMSDLPTINLTGK
ncbi:hypothetical protein N7532_009815 [Penicillium argentinense]|uniref:Non-reducing end beta-L-arabinofuranosidase-like GH127 middle domain-containing protein n=1 Tax=Penicillium argentinense TaxID=1131581 RepID=A0A9W9ENQ9_9EURO|nr:uncharacterized protein N7532_009815 [Penicillium argentinense]KAJ5085044.1 hypothetical protein N7532_009815 [Penicillium argentinense]